ncbi:MAG: nitric oxide dioxygenase [Oleiphilaceae bacterium]|jgi:nitric oxide dioxygenase
MLDKQTIATVQATIPLLQSTGSVLTEHFYNRMFTHNPELKDQFNMAHQHSGGQATALFNAVFAYAKYLDQPEVLASAIERIAQKHTSFLITKKQYNIVGGHLLASIKELAGDVATDEVITAWAAAYGQLADIFIVREEEIYSSNDSQEGGWRDLRQFTVIEKIAESDVITSFVLSPTDGGMVMNYKPGQYLGVHVDPKLSDNKEIRQYSLSDAPNGQTYRISVKRETLPIVGVVSNYLHNEAEVGSHIHVIPPAGDFFLEVQTTTPVVLLSGGVGLTPMVSMLNKLVKDNHQGDVNYLHACLDSKHHAFSSHVASLAEQHENVFATTWYQTPEANDKLGIDYHHAGFINLDTVSDKILQPDTHYYFCGPVPFMQAINDKLLGLGVKGEHIHYEMFGPHASL